jgi:hypothetical protein
MLYEGIRNNTILTGNDLGMLGNIETFPDEEEKLKHMLDTAL